MMKLLRKIHEEKGFTLIELIFVVIILAVLAGVALINLGSSEDDAKEAAVKADLRTLATALKVYKAKTGSFPASSLDDLATASGSYQPMLDEIPVDPFASNGTDKYNYTRAEDGSSATVSSDRAGFSRTVR